MPCRDQVRLIATTCKTSQGINDSVLCAMSLIELSVLECVGLVFVCIPQAVRCTLRVGDKPTSISVAKVRFGIPAVHAMSFSVVAAARAVTFWRRGPRHGQAGSAGFDKNCEMAPWLGLECSSAVPFCHWAGGIRVAAICAHTQPATRGTTSSPQPPTTSSAQPASAWTPGLPWANR